MAFIDKDADPDLRHDGALLVADALEDLSILRRIFFTRPGE